MNALYRKEERAVKVLLVDDFPVIVESLKNGVKWEKTGVTEVYSAYSAREAKLLLMNFSIDVLLCDIEMPQENGLELVKWTRENFPLVECIFLTAHAEFAYAKEAVRIGCFDYILQPVKFQDVEEVMERVARELDRKKQESRMATMTQKAINREGEIIEMMYAKIQAGEDSAANLLCIDYRLLCTYFFSGCAVYQMIVEITRWKQLLGLRKEVAAGAEIKADLIELLGENHVRVAVVEVENNRFWCLIFADREIISEKVWEEKLQEFYGYIDRNREYEILVFSALEEVGEDCVQSFRELRQAEADKTDQRKGVIIKKDYSGTRKKENPVIEAARKYIEKNLNKNMSRSEVAQQIHLSEEYFSRLFKQETGYTFKDYLMMVKMEAAKDFLSKTQLSVSIIASKVGYSNFSYFSHTFKNYTGVTPQEYRKTEHDRN